MQTIRHGRTFCILLCKQYKLVPAREYKKKEISTPSFRSPAASCGEMTETGKEPASAR